MSITALMASEKPFTCTLCGKDIVTEEEVVVVLYTEVAHVPGYEYGDWVVDTDWKDEHVTHVSCFDSAMV